MRHRYELPQAHWERIASFFPHPTHHGGRGRPLEDHRRILNGILWRLHTGAPWRDIPERYGPWETIYGRFRRWRRDGTWAKILTQLLDDLDRDGRLGHQLWLVDATIVRASRAASGAKKKSVPDPASGGLVQEWPVLGNSQGSGTASDTSPKRKRGAALSLACASGWCPKTVTRP